MAAYSHFSTTTLSLTADSSEDTLSLSRRGDGSITFVDADGNTVKAHSNVELTKLFNALASME